jgi:uncharacterized glyoxalase superfamily protein PhnB
MQAVYVEVEDREYRAYLSVRRKAPIRGGLATDRDIPLSRAVMAPVRGGKRSGLLSRVRNEVDPMNAPHKPANYSTVSPYLIVNGADATIAFLKRVFGAIELRRFPDVSGKLMHAEVRLDDTVIMLADPAPPDWPAISSYVHIYVRDVDATYRSALEAGAVSVQEPVKKQDEDKRGGVRDAGGTTWWIATKVE